MRIFLKVLLGFGLLGLFIFLFSFTNEKSLLFEKTSAFHRANFSRESELLFVGDVMFGRKIASLIEERGMGYPFELIKDRLNESDMVIANLEGPISARGKNQGSIYSFRFKPEIVSILKEANIGAVSLANNHIWDWGSDALSDTLLHLENAGIKFAGAGLDYQSANEPTKFRLGKNDFAMFSFTNLYPSGLEASSDPFGELPSAGSGQTGASRMGVSDFDAVAVENQIKALKKDGVDIVIASFHWGSEYETRSSIAEQLIARKLIDIGADLVVGHHPHVVQEIEEYKNMYIAYSLGNFMFDQNFSKDTSNGLMLSVRIKNGMIEALEPIKVCFNEIYQPYICSS
jgi:poly-gamma-glutamate synthesis protein (capsule biosynthesis protein)